MSNMKITFLGSGNIARAIIKGLIANGTPATEITAADPMKSALAEAGKLGINVTTDNQSATRCADVIIISVKLSLKSRSFDQLIIKRFIFKNFLLRFSQCCQGFDIFYFVVLLDRLSFLKIEIVLYGSKTWFSALNFSIE